ncbi:hypothetical protein [Levilactobacillus spicheri]|uniref:Uncharacterized protein n=2 Tax=Levilactobacillus spicheri TaxID=216463 RepID=A0A0F3RUW8_9LACO|nr:hypothetical protein [Levilactobacillus spicheri]KJW13776.1 hypothetical protein VC81_00915 [Levilactobacillus spicheri]KRL48112.1 hypothetical protein FD37_GL001673 [Levilactobacillus spicheri DSM 15429]GEO67587.1 hypothetical protein LSP04_20060 [Levilactobacillus spicheri]
MFIQIPTDMDEVELRQLQLKKLGDDRSEESIIQQAVLDTFQTFLDQIEDGHYDTASWQDGNLIVTDITGQQTATVQPHGESFVADFRQNADQTQQYLEEQAIDASGSR